MQKEKRHSPTDEISGNTRNSPVKTYKTPAGPLFLRSCCSPAFVEDLKVDEGLRAFARLPEREHNLLLSTCLALGLLTWDGQRYSNNPAPQNFLVSTVRSYAGDYYLRQISAVLFDCMQHIRALLHRNASIYHDAR